MSRYLRSPFFLSLLNSTAVMLFLGVFGLVAILFQVALEDAKRDEKMYVNLKDSVTPGKAKQLQKQLGQQPFVANITYTSKEDALETYAPELGDDFEEVMSGINPLYASLDVQLAPEYTNLDSFVKLKNRLLVNYRWEIEDVVYDIELMEVVNRRSGVLRMVALALGLLLAVLSFYLIASTTRILIHGQRFAIRSMQLVGAQDAYIRRPFVRLGVLQGGVAGLISVGLIFGLLLGLDRWLGSDFLGINFARLLQKPAVLVFFGGLLAFALAIGFFSSRFAVNRFLNKSLDELS